MCEILRCSCSGIIWTALLLGLQCPCVDAVFAVSSMPAQLEQLEPFSRRAPLQQVSANSKSEEEDIASVLQTPQTQRYQNLSYVQVFCIVMFAFIACCCYGLTLLSLGKFKGTSLHRHNPDDQNWYAIDVRKLEKISCLRLDPAQVHLLKESLIDGTFPRNQSLVILDESNSVKRGNQLEVRIESVEDLHRPGPPGWWPYDKKKADDYDSQRYVLIQQWRDPDDKDGQRHWRMIIRVPPGGDWDDPSYSDFTTKYVIHHSTLLCPDVSESDEEKDMLEQDEEEALQPKMLGYIGCPELLKDAEIESNVKTLITTLVQRGHAVTVGMQNKQLADGTGAQAYDMSLSLLHAKADMFDIVLVAPGGTDVQAEAEHFRKHAGFVYFGVDTKAEGTQGQPTIAVGKIGTPRWLTKMAGKKEIHDLHSMIAEDVAAEM